MKSIATAKESFSIGSPDIKIHSSLTFVVRVLGSHLDFNLFDTIETQVRFAEGDAPKESDIVMKVEKYFVCAIGGNVSDATTDLVS